MALSNCVSQQYTKFSTGIHCHVDGFRCLLALFQCHRKQQHRQVSCQNDRCTNSLEEQWLQMTWNCSCFHIVILFVRLNCQKFYMSEKPIRDCVEWTGLTEIRYCLGLCYGKVLMNLPLSFHCITVTWILSTRIFLSDHIMENNSRGK